MTSILKMKPDLTTDLISQILTIYTSNQLLKSVQSKQNA